MTRLAFRRSRDPIKTPAVAEHDPIAFGRPVTFGSTMGVVYPGDAPVGVLMVGAAGYEELCLRTTWRALAEAISAAGLPCMRFDLPGVGDALEPRAPEGVEDWRLAVIEAARALKAETGCERIAVLGQGIGASLAALAAPDMGPIEAAVFMAPVTNGRIYLRELSLWGAMLVDRIGIGLDPDQASATVGGIAIAPGRLAALKALDLSVLAMAPAPKSLVVARANHGGDERFAERLEALGVTVGRIAYEGYEIIASDPTQARPPERTIAWIAEWLSALAPSGARTAAPRPAGPPAAPLVGDGFRERPLRFGPGGRLFGVVCEPETRRPGPAVVFVNAGRDYHIGWARTTIDQARALARLGLASLRFDCAGVGDSPPAPDFDGEFLYSDAQIGDVLAAIDELAAQGHDRIGVMGRCSGSYAAFHAAVRDRRVTDLVMINTERFVWDPREDVNEALRFAQRPIGDFGATLWRRNGVMRLLKGQLNVVPAAKYVSRRMMRTLGRRVAPYLGRLTPEARLFSDVHRKFRGLSERGASVTIVYAENDHGLIEFEAYFGRDGERLAAYPKARRALVPEADHNFTHRGARQRLFETLKGVLLG